MTIIEEPSDLDQQVPEIEQSGADGDPSVDQHTEIQPQHEVTPLKSEIDLLKQRVAELERENLQLFRRESDLKSKYIQLLEKNQR